MTLWVSPTNSPVRLGISPAASTPTVFSVRGSESLFPLTGTLGCVVCLTPQLFLPVFLHKTVGPACPPAIALPQVLSTWLLVCAPPAGLDECFFFNSLVVGLPYRSIFWQFWLFFVFKFVDVLLLVCARRQRVSSYASILARCPQWSDSCLVSLPLFLTPLPSL